MSKRLLDNHSRIFHAARTCERFDNTDKKVGRNCQIVSGAGCRTERFLQAIKGRRLLIITTNVVKQIQKLSQAGFIDISALLTHARWPVLSDAHRFSQHWLYRSQVCPRDYAGLCAKER